MHFCGYFLFSRSLIFEGGGGLLGVEMMEGGGWSGKEEMDFFFPLKIWFRKMKCKSQS